MKTEFMKWGNSLALRIPSGFSREVGASVGKVEGNKKRRRYSLEQLLEGITRENYYQEIDWGPSRGNEAW
jgi:antitoxin MazE